ncbi:unnamed protein product [Blepharisma stoltei]|uniref:Uncharacterized protein n=1 Tax=Blepharisma stoltei TaxID=1481888 RepID=A0AAU9IUU9_9CILI|nr:unnamed protein product [Blepharisma stoltei]
MDKKELERRLSLSLEPDFFSHSLRPVFCDPPILYDREGKLRGADIREILSFKDSTITNLCSYSATDEEFRLEHVENNVIIKCEGPADGQKFKVKFIEQPFIEDGINYLGKIEFQGKKGRKVMIRVPGERTYDPASPENPIVTADQFRFLISILIAQVIAAMNGADQDLILKIMQTSKHCHKLHNRYLLQKYLTSQVVSAFYEGETQESYGEFLLKSLADGQPNLDPTRDFYQINYLELEAKKVGGHMRGEDVLPAQNYLKELLKRYEDQLRLEQSEPTIALLITISGRFEFSAYLGVNHLEIYLNKEMLARINSFQGIGMKSIRDRISKLEQSYDIQFKLALKRRGIRQRAVEENQKSDCSIF